jgi:CheY-like chemotaxis protein
VSSPPLVLVVDDEEEVRTLICEILEAEGYRTRALDSGAALLELVPIERPALIFLDIYLPGLDGYTVASRLRALPDVGRTPIIFVTAAEGSVHRTLSAGLGAVYLPKPFTVAQLVRAVGRALPGPEGPR